MTVKYRTSGRKDQPMVKRNSVVVSIEANIPQAVKRIRRASVVSAKVLNRMTGRAHKVAAAFANAFTPVIDAMEQPHKKRVDHVKTDMVNIGDKEVPVFVSEKIRKMLGEAGYGKET